MPEEGTASFGIHSEEAPHGEGDKVKANVRSQPCPYLRYRYSVHRGFFFINFDFYKIRERSLFHKGRHAVPVWLINGSGTILQQRRHEILCDILKYNLSQKQHLFPLGLI